MSKIYPELWATFPQSQQTHKEHTYAYSYTHNNLINQTTTFPYLQSHQNPNHLQTEK